jgi:glycosyltransferase involved in cell wall biosynthesis
MSVPIKITAIVCTYNRSQQLAATIESLVAQSLSGSLPWEILVVDNNSRDETRQVVERLQSKYPERIRYLIESQQGVSCARNTGIRESRGEILAFIDDDETADKAWLQNLTANLLSGEWAGAGGRVLPLWSVPCPQWLSPHSPLISGPLASFDPSQGPGRLTEPPFGANMAFRKEVFDKYGTFRTDLGRAGTSMISNEDTEFGRRLFAAGEPLRYERSAITFHPVEEARLRQEYFLKWWFNKGRSDIRETRAKHSGKRLLGVPLRLFGSVAAQLARWMVSTEGSQRFNHKVDLWNSTGQVLEFSLLWRAAKNGKGLKGNTDLRRREKGDR